MGITTNLSVKLSSHPTTRFIESHNLTHKLNRILESKSNSAQRFPELNASLPKGRSAGRVENSAQRFPMGRVVRSSY
ncbi:hypothetical protein [Leptospira noguchii]|uniref:hypothetical protein n=1 Tax=Leptospira noguchii TaxID=28182 RepID=UPI001FB6CF9C|nr:hypothetical protein [Leptospira noguchii]UOG59373.1 hypothetical protein MAL07_11185 [Leptospira noguchii]